MTRRKRRRYLHLRPLPRLLAGGGCCARMVGCGCQISTDEGRACRSEFCDGVFIVNEDCDCAGECGFAFRASPGFCGFDAG